MQDKQLFEYAVIRVVPRVEREEFLNIGVILYSRNQKFLGVKYTLDEGRLLAFYPNTDISALKEYICAFDKVSKGGKEGGPIGQLDMASRFRWLTAPRSTIVQISKVHSGLSEDAAGTLDRLHQQLVL